MKKFILLILALLPLVGCNESTVDYRESEKRPFRVRNAEKFKFENHDYIVFSSTIGEGYCVVHDPECRKCK